MSRNMSGALSGAIDEMLQGSVAGNISFNGGGGGGSTVTITPTLESGTKIADYSIDDVDGSLYAPTPTYIEANPEDEGTVELEKLLVGDTIYYIPTPETPTTVIANPEGTATNELEKLQVGDNIYSVGGSISITQIYSGDSWASPAQLDDSIFDYDFIIITGYATAGTGYMVSNIYKTSDLSLNKNIGYSDDVAFNWWKITANDTLTDSGHSGTYYLKSVYGIKL